MEVAANIFPGNRVIWSEKWIFFSKILGIWGPKNPELLENRIQNPKNFIPTTSWY